MIVNGVLISGMAGGDRTARGFIEGYDPETGKRLWRTWTIPAPGEKGSETWPNKEFPDAWKYGGGATWQPGSYDPVLDLFYIGTGNAEPYNPKYRMGMDSLYAASLLAIRPKTGEMVWYYQFLPNDSFDFDGTAESILADIQVDGKPRKVLFNVNKNGFLYVLDRTNGQLLAAHPFVNQNWAKYIDLKTGRPVLTDLLDRAIKGETIDLLPRLGTNATLSAYNPKTGLLFLNSWELIRVLEIRRCQTGSRRGLYGHRDRFQNFRSARLSPSRSTRSAARSRGRCRSRNLRSRRARSRPTAACCSRAS